MVLDKKLYIVEGEKLYLRYIKLPKVKNKYVNEMIKNELKQYFRQNENIIFAYFADKSQYNYTVYYSANNGIFSGVKKNKRMGFIQIALMQYYSKMIKNENYFLASQVNGFYYIFLCKKGIITANEVFENSQFKDENSLSKVIYSFISKESNSEKANIYFVNFDKSMQDNIGYKLSDKINDLGFLNFNNLTKSYKKIYFEQLYGINNDDFCKSIMKVCVYCLIIILIFFNIILSIINLNKDFKLEETDKRNNLMICNSNKKYNNNSLNKIKSKIVINSYDRIQKFIGENNNFKINYFKINDNECNLKIEDIDNQEYYVLLRGLKNNGFELKALSSDKADSNTALKDLNDITITLICKENNE